MKTPVLSTSIKLHPHTGLHATVQTAGWDTSRIHQKLLRLLNKRRRVCSKLETLSTTEERFKSAHFSIVLGDSSCRQQTRSWHSGTGGFYLWARLSGCIFRVRTAVWALRSGVSQPTPGGMLMLMLTALTSDGHRLPAAANASCPVSFSAASLTPQQLETEDGDSQTNYQLKWIKMR